jgi:hypothetical protein
LTKKKKRELTIEPFEVQGETKYIPVSEIKPGYEKLLEISEAIVAYFDVLGFSTKTDPEDVRLTLLDFSGPLALAAERFSAVRFSVFSDCAFVAAPLKCAREIISAIRFAFQEWIADGILVRGGITIGEYSETLSYAVDRASKNFKGNLFAGSGVNNAVALEHGGNGALLFTDSKCAEFYQKNFNERIFKLEERQVIGWSNDKQTLTNFVGISLWQLLKVISKKGMENPVAEKLANNIVYSLNATKDLLPRSLMLAILSSPLISPEKRQIATKFFKIKDPHDFSYFKEITKEWHRSDRFKMIKALADMNSSS